MLIQYLLNSSEVYNTGSEPRPWIFQDANFSVPTDHLNLKKDTLLREVTGRELKTMKVCLKKQNKTTVWTELKDDWSAETVPVSAAVTTRRRIYFAPLPLADTDMQMLLLCDTTHRLRTDANKQPLKTNHNPKEWRVILLFFFFPRGRKKYETSHCGWCMIYNQCCGWALCSARLQHRRCRPTAAPPQILFLATFRVVGLIWRCQESSPLGKHIKDSERESVFS